MDTDSPNLFNYIFSDETAIYNIINLAMQEPALCEEFFEYIQAPLVNLSISPTDSDSEDDKGMCFECNSAPQPTSCPSEPVFDSTAGRSRAISSKITFKDSKKLYANFIANCREFAKLQQSANSAKCQKKLAQIYSELNFVIQESMNIKGNVDLFIAMIMSWTEELRLKNYENFYNRYAIANRSKVKIVVEDFQRVDSIKKNDGLLRIYIESSCNRQYIHFDRKQSFILYLIYLLDRYYHDLDVEAIDISIHKNLFCKLFELTYHENGVIEFDNLKRKVTHGAQRPVQLKDCLSDIRKNIEKAFVSLGLKEERLPFVIPSENSHLTVRSKNIIIPDSLSAITI